MKYSAFGKTGFTISKISFGAGPISTLMVGDFREKQCLVVEHAITRGINWFDTAATYGEGTSEQNLGQALVDLKRTKDVHIATKVRLTTDDLRCIRSAVRRSIETSLQRLHIDQVAVLQLHNAITVRRGDEPTSVTPEDVLGQHGVLAAFQELKSEGLIKEFGLTGTGQTESLRQVVRSGEFGTLQVPYHLLNASAGQASNFRDDLCHPNYGNIITECAERGMGVLAIRVLAGGALAGNPPSPHTFKTPFFPLAMYERDRKRAARLQSILGSNRSLQSEAIRFATSHSDIHSALIGFAECWQIDDAIAAMELSEGSLSWDDVCTAFDSTVEAI
jgi:aryl-alcohol dehydrogenase-like predicted oxidoreductase